MDYNRILTPEEEIELGRRAASDEAARNALVMHNQGFLKKMVSEFHQKHRSMDFDDLMQEGNIGLMNAATRFDPDREVRFITYARFWIMQALNTTLEQSFGLIRIPTNRADDLVRIRKAMNETGSTDPQTLSKTANVPEDTVKNLLPYDKPFLSLDSPMFTPSGDEGDAMVDHIGAIDVDFDSSLAKNDLQTILDKLPERHRDILISRYGVFGHSEMTLKELSAKYGVSREAIRQMEHRALAKCREVA